MMLGTLIGWIVYHPVVFLTLQVPLLNFGVIDGVKLCVIYAVRLYTIVLLMGLPPLLGVGEGGGGLGSPPLPHHDC
jgi:hypothetical protein